MAKIKELNIVSPDIIESKIFLIRGQKVMLDSDLAKLYKIETRALNQAVKRNIEKFPDDFMFSLKREEIMNLSQFVISLKIKHSPNVQVFTEQGVAMLSSVLKSKKAVEINIAIMRTFVNIRKFVSSYEGLSMKIAELENKYDNKIVDIYKILDEFRKDDLGKMVEIGFKP